MHSSFYLGIAKGMLWGFLVSLLLVAILSLDGGKFGDHVLQHVQFHWIK